MQYNINNHSIHLKMASWTSLLFCLISLTWAVDATIDSVFGNKVELGGSFYMITMNAVSRRDAFLVCRARGMHLVTIDTDEKHTLITEWLKSLAEYANEGVWTGGLRLGGTDNWFWRRTGEAIAVDDARWLDGQPDELSNEQCVLSLRGGALGWIDTPADIRDEDFVFFYALCEF